MGDRDNITVKAAHVSIDGTDVGFTTGGVSFRKEITYVDVEADQTAGTIKKVIVGEKGFVTFTMLESTLTNLRNAMNEPAANLISGTSLHFGSAAPAVVEHTLTITGEGVNGQTRTWSFYRAVSAEAVEHSLGRRDGPNEIPLVMEVLKDEDKNDKFGYAADG